MNDGWVLDQIQVAMNNLEKNTNASDPTNMQAQMTNVMVFIAAVYEAMNHRD